MTILRVCPIVGPNANNFIANAFKKPVLPAIGSADPPMQFLHEDDLVRTVALGVLKLRPSAAIYNVAGDGTIRWSEMVSVIQKRPLIRLPAPLWYFLTSAAWRLRIQDDSPACGLELYPIPLDCQFAEKLKAASLASSSGTHLTRASGSLTLRRNRANPQ